MSQETAEYQEAIHERESRWQAEQEKISQLEELTPDMLGPAFEDEPGVCTCVDEGTDGDIRIAGSGILHAGGLEAVATLLRDAGVKEITSHDGCSAVKEAYRRTNGLSADATIDSTAANAFGQAWSQKLSTSLGVPYRHIASAEMQRPPDWHDASTIYLDFTGNFQPHKVPALPKGFVLSSALLSPRELEADAKFTAGIALSDKGFGERFTIEQPLAVIAVGDVDDEYTIALEKLPDDFGGRLTVQRLAVPELATAAA